MPPAGHNRHNDYGLGLYCTRDVELAREWACSTRVGGFTNKYALTIDGLSFLNLSDPQFRTLDWLAVLVNNRTFDISSPIAVEAKEYLTEHFLPDTGPYDVICGYRADDSYFSFALDFLNNAISLRQLNRAMVLGSLGEQIMLKSSKAFLQLAFAAGEPVDGEVYFAKRHRRDKEAREQYFTRERVAPRQRDDLFMLDILRQELRHGDARLQEELSRQRL